MSQGPGRPILGRLDTARAVIGFGLGVIALVWSAIGWDLDHERDKLLRGARSDTGNLARAFEEHFLRTVAGLDQTLLYLKAEYERAPAAFDLNASIANATILRQVSVQIARIDAAGRLADSNVAGWVPVDLADREHFRVHRQARTGTLFVSKPVLGRASGKWSIQLTRRLDGANGAFAGVLVISLDPHYLGDFYGSFDIGADGSVVVVGRDGVVRADSRGGHWLGRSVADDGLLGRVFHDGHGALEGGGPLDMVPRITSYRVLGDLPLAVLVGRSERDVLAPHGAATMAYVLVGLALTVALGGVALLLYTLVRRQERTARDLMVKKAELTESRERLRRYVADLERIAEVSAHDLQEPLRRVVAYAQLLAKHAENVLDEEGRGYVAQVVQGAHRMRKLVQDLEAFVAVDHLPAPEQLHSAEEAVAVATQRLAEQVEIARATLVVDPLPRVASDPRSLAEIFTQLMDNALRYRRHDGKPVVHVTARSEDGMAVFSVRDNGIGMERRHLSRIFEIFHRLHGIDDNPGTGMGLAIVRRMVERQGGRVWVESQPGLGSAFSFSLPMALASAQTESSPDQEARAA